MTRQHKCTLVVRLHQTVNTLSEIVDELESVCHTQRELTALSEAQDAHTHACDALADVQRMIGE